MNPILIAVSQNVISQQLCHLTVSTVKPAANVSNQPLKSQQVVQLTKCRQYSSTVLDEYYITECK